MLRKILLLCSVLLPALAFSENYVLDVGEEQILFVPDVSMGVVDHTVWSCDKSNIVFIEKSNSGAKIKVSSYFEDAATVSLIYVSKYYDAKGFTRSYTGTKYYTIQCKGTAPTIVPSGINLKVGETYQLHISPSSYESQTVWSAWNPINAEVSNTGVVTAEKEGDDIIFATISGLSSPLTCWVKVINPKLSLKADVKSGEVEKGKEVTLTASKTSATIYYTLDGTSPEQNGDKYTEPIKINANATLKAIAYDNDEEKEPSDILTREYTVIETDASENDNIIYTDNAKVFAGDEMTLSVKMKNTVPIRGFQFNLYLPSGITVAKNSKDRFMVSLNEERLAEDDEHTISASEQDDGSILVLCGSQYDETFTGNDGEIVSIKLQVAESMKSGNYDITLKHIKLTESDINKKYETDVFKSTINVLLYILGDINGDQQVDVSDYIGIANRIHGNTPEEFIEKVGDVNNDGTIDISDYIGVANLIHTGSIYGDELLATITTNDATNMAEKGATLNGTLTVTSATKPYTVGFFVSSEGTPSSDNYIKKLEAGSNKKGTFSSTVSGLDYTTTYYYCAYILYEGVYYYGETKNFTTTKKTTYAIGDLYPADNPMGVVFYTSNEGKSGKIFSLENVFRNWYGAKSWASSYGSGWYLPSKSELQQIARNISLFKQHNYISPWEFWSSNKDAMSSGAIYEYAYVVDLSGGASYSRVADQSYHVVAVRSF